MVDRPSGPSFPPIQPYVVPPITPPASGLAISPVDETGWMLAFEDGFRNGVDLMAWSYITGTALQGCMLWDATAVATSADGLTLSIFYDGMQWHGGGLQQRLSLNAMVTYYRVEARMRVPAAQGIGPIVAMIPQSGDSLPMLRVVEAPGSVKQQASASWHWVGPAGSQDDQTERATFVLDMTQWHVFTAEQTAAGFRYWIDGVPQSTPDSWEQNNNGLVSMIMMLGSFVAVASDAWYGGAPDGTTPLTYTSYTDYVRIWTPA